MSRAPRASVSSWRLRLAWPRSVFSSPSIRAETRASPALAGPRSRGARGGDADRDAVAQPIRPVDHDGIARGETGQDGGVSAIARTQRHFADGHGVIRVDEIHVVARRAAQHRRSRNENRLRQRIHQDFDVDELVREKCLVVVLEFRTQCHGAGTGSHLIAECVERSSRDLLVVVARIGSDRKLRTGIDALDHFGDVVLCDRELDGRRLHGGDDHDAGRARGRDVIARVDQAQPHAARYRRGDVAVDEVELELGDIGLVRLDLSLVLLHGGFLIGNRLLGNGLLRL